ncbi:MAG: DUF72 domain-containing protein [bacterium]|nr:DUF72 domain-containing protein [bacterium]
MPIAQYHLGCPIWSNKDWVGELFTSKAKTGDFLHQYASVFNTVEGNSTFYGLPTEDTVTRWKEQTPQDFQFCFKFPRAVSHDKKLVESERETQEFLDRIAPLQDRLGPLFLQLSPAFAPTLLPVLDRFLSGLPKNLHYAVEVRHPDFFSDAEADLNTCLKERGVDRVTFDTRGLHSATTSDPATQAAQKKKPQIPVRFTATGHRPFIRFVGHPDVDKNLSLLGKWATVTASWIQEDRTPYIFMHMSDEFYAPRLARHFHRLLSEHLNVGNLPVWPAEQEQPEEQLNLF